MSAISLRGPLLLFYSLAIGLCAGVLGIMIGYGLGELGFSTGLLHADADIDDDMALTVIGFAMVGGLIGVIAGIAFGWRVITGKGRG